MEEEGLPPKEATERSMGEITGALVGIALVLSAVFLPMAFFTGSTGFANPAITVGRMFSDTFAGISPSSVPSFVAAQVIGGGLAVVVITVLYPDITPAEAADIMFPHSGATEATTPGAGPQDLTKDTA